jgi:hypothetical protein
MDLENTACILGCRVVSNAVAVDFDHSLGCLDVKHDSGDSINVVLLMFTSEQYQMCDN